MSGPHVLVGPRITLRSPRQQDMADRLALGRDPEIVRMFGGDTNRPLPPVTDAEASHWLEQLASHPHAWVAEHDGRLIGEARLDGVSQTDGRARLALGILDPAKLGRGLGREIVRLVLKHAFDDLGLHRVDLRVLDYNLRAISCYRACGFVEEGRERQAALVAGVRHDDVIMSILKHEFLENHRTAMFGPLALVPVVTEKDWADFHSIRRAELFDARGRGDAYDPTHADDHASQNTPMLLRADEEAIGELRIDDLGQGIAVLRLVAIRRDRQRYGFGTKMIELALTRLRKGGCAKVVVNAAPDSVNFYRRLGFQEERWPDEHAATSVQMTLKLSAL